MEILQKAINTYYTETKGDAPKCFKNNEYKIWSKLEEFAHTEPRKFPCRDCSSSFQNEMRKKGSCHIPMIPVEKIAR